MSKSSWAVAVKDLVDLVDRHGPTVKKLLKDSVADKASPLSLVRPVEHEIGCPYCGSGIDEDDKTCAKCGGPLPKRVKQVMFSPLQSLEEPEETGMDEDADGQMSVKFPNDIAWVCESCGKQNKAKKGKKASRLFIDHHYPDKPWWAGGLWEGPQMVTDKAIIRCSEYCSRCSHGQEIYSREWYTHRHRVWFGTAIGG